MYRLDINLDNPDQEHRITLDASVYSLRFRWNTISSCWHCYVGKVGGDFKAKFKLTVARDLLEAYRQVDGVPKGMLLLLDLEKTTGRCGRSDVGLGRRFQLAYITEEEYNAISSQV